ncbi:hypothetical protein WMF30_22275 [Sorangium sp. So ce134]
MATAYHGEDALVQAVLTMLRVVVDHASDAAILAPLKALARQRERDDAIAEMANDYAGGW